MAKLSPKPGQGDSTGFTLVEMLLALTIFTISAAVFFKIIAANLDRSRDIRDHMVGTMLLQSLLARADVIDAGRIGVSQGLYPNGFHWRLAVEPYGNDQRIAGLNRVEAKVSWTHGTQTQNLSLVTLRAVYPRADHD